MVLCRTIDKRAHWQVARVFPGQAEASTHKSKAQRNTIERPDAWRIAFLFKVANVMDRPLRVTTVSKMNVTSPKMVRDPTGEE